MTANFAVWHTLSADGDLIMYFDCYCFMLSWVLNCWSWSLSVWILLQLQHILSPSSPFFSFLCCSLLAYWTKVHITTTQQQSLYGPLSGTTRVSRYQKKHSPTHHPDHHPVFISFFHLLRSIASSLFKLRAWQPFCTTYVPVLFGLPLGLEPSTSYSIHFFTQSVSSFLQHMPIPLQPVLL